MWYQGYDIQDTLRRALIPRMPPDVPRCTQMRPDTPRYAQIHPDTLRYTQVRPDTPRYAQMRPDAPLQQRCTDSNNKNLLR